MVAVRADGLYDISRLVPTMRDLCEASEPARIVRDGKGEQDTARFDTTHRVEMPLGLGAFGLRADPYIEGRGTAWSNGDGSGGDPTRGASRDPEFLKRLHDNFDSATPYLETVSVLAQADHPSSEDVAALIADAGINATTED